MWFDDSAGLMRYRAPLGDLSRQISNSVNVDVPENVEMIKGTGVERFESPEPDIWFHLSYSEFRSVHPAIEVRRSPLHGLGVFVRSGMMVKAQTWLAWYPGRRKLWDDNKFYEYGMGIGKYVWDASEATGKTAIGHYVNSSHPSLPAPYNASNAVYICVTVGSSKGSGKKKGKTIRAGVYAEHDIGENVEILTDYHWFLDGVIHTCDDGRKIKLFCSCDECDDLRRIRPSPQ